MDEGLTGGDEDRIVVRGARVHNLRDVSVSLPRGRMTVVTGVSGSGKSSLAFDTIFAEGQRRYLESLPPHARQFLERLERPDVDYVGGLAPAIAIGRPTAAAGPRSTLATVSEIHDHLRLLFAHLGTAHCPHCGRVVRAISPGALAERLLREPEGTRLTVLSPMLRRPPRGAKPRADGRRGGAYVTEAAQAGFVRVRIDGAVRPLEEISPAEADRAREIDAVVDRLVVREGVRTRLADSVELAMRRSGGEIRLLLRRPGEAEDALVNESDRLSCPDCGLFFDRLVPASFSFNGHLGACPACQGLGRDAEGRVCRACGGARLRPESLACRIADLGEPGPNVAEVLAMTVSDLRVWAGRLGKALSPVRRRMAAGPLAGLSERLAFLEEAGLGYLTADRESATLSGGELRRVRLASALGQRLGGVLYVLDEPTAGLHPHDVDRLVGMLGALRARGNTLVAVEHNARVIRAADHVVDVGPGAGREGGRIVFEGSVPELLRSDSLTGRRLRGEGAPPLPARRSPDAETEFLVVRGARARNLRDVEARFPLGRITVVTGVSGSGKSTLVEEVLGANLLRRTAPGARGAPPAWEGCDGIALAERIDRVIEVGRAARVRSPRGNPLTFTGVWDRVRELYAATPLARARGYGPSRFSFNAKGGRCEACRGEGAVRLEMSFLPDVTVPCEACGGRRFNRETLDVHWRGRSVADLLELPVREALPLFREIPALARVFGTLEDVGLGYLTLGQPLSTLSGGEAQRLLLAAELARAARGRVLYLLDEPSAGQHFADVDRLLAELFRLRDAGHTVVVVEHNPQVMRAADWIVDLGPGGGPDGGRVVAQGAPDEVRRAKGSLTAAFL